MKGTRRDHTAPDGIVRPSLDDPFVRGLSEAVGGPAGQRGLLHRVWAPVQVLLLLTALTFALGMTTKVNCVGDEWQDATARYTHACYSDIPYLYTWRGFADANWPYTDDADVRAAYDVMEYPAGISYWAWGTAHVTSWIAGSPEPGDPDRDLNAEAVTYTAVNVVGFAAIAMLTTWLLAGVHRRRPWDAAGWALAPALALTAVINWDLLAVAAVAGAAWTWARGRPVATGVLIGIGTTIKLYPLFLLGAVLVLCLRHRRLKPFVRALVAAVLAWLVTNLPALLTGPDQWMHFWRFNSDRGADLGSLWIVLQDVTGSPLSLGLVNNGSWAVLILGCFGVLWLGLTAPSTPRFAQLGFLILAAFLLINKVYSPQYVLWLLPLAVLAHPRWRDLIIWQAGEVIYFFVVWFHLADLSKTASEQPVIYWVAIMIRIAAQLWFVAMVVRGIRNPALDPVAEERGELYGADAYEPDSHEPAPSSSSNYEETTTRSKDVAV